MTPIRPTRRPGVEAEESAGSYVLYDPERDRVHLLNHTAALVLELCTGKNTPEDIVSLMQSAYELPRAPETEIRECLDQLLSEGLIE